MRIYTNLGEGGVEVSDGPACWAMVRWDDCEEPRGLFLAEGLDIWCGPSRKKTSFVIVRSPYNSAPFLLGFCPQGGDVNSWRRFPTMADLVDFMELLGFGPHLRLALRKQFGGFHPEEPNMLDRVAEAQSAQEEVEAGEEEVKGESKFLRLEILLRGNGFDVDGDAEGLRVETKNNTSSREAARLYRMVGVFIRPESRPNIKVMVEAGSPFSSDPRRSTVSVLRVCGISDADLL